MNEVRFSAEKLSSLMKRRGLTDYGVSELTGISRTMVFYLRKGKRPKPAAEIVTKLANGLQIPLAELMTDDGAPKDPGQKAVPESILQLTDIAERLSEVRREELVRIATALEKLEREQSTSPIPPAAMQVIMAFLEKSRQEGADKNTLDSLENLLRAAGAQDLGSSRGGSSLAQNSDNISDGY